MEIGIAAAALIMGYMVSRLLYKPFIATKRVFFLYMEDLRSKDIVHFYGEEEKELSRQELESLINKL